MAASLQSSYGGASKIAQDKLTGVTTDVCGWESWYFVEIKDSRRYDLMSEIT
jgi:hypothetical protein